MGAPLIRHTVCQTVITATRLAYRHGRLNIEPPYCPGCHEALTEHNIESADDLAHRLLVIARVEKDPAPVPDTLMAGMMDRWTDLDDALANPELPPTVRLAVIEEMADLDNEFQRQGGS